MLRQTEGYGPYKPVPPPKPLPYPPPYREPPGPIRPPGPGEPWISPGPPEFGGGVTWSPNYSRWNTSEPVLPGSLVTDAGTLHVHSSKFPDAYGRSEWEPLVTPGRVRPPVSGHVRSPTGVDNPALLHDQGQPVPPGPVVSLVTSPTYVTNSESPYQSRLPVPTQNSRDAAEVLDHTTEAPSPRQATPVGESELQENEEKQEKNRTFPGKAYHHLKDMISSKWGNKNNSPEKLEMGAKLERQESGRHTSMNQSFRKAILKSSQKSNLQPESNQPTMNGYVSYGNPGGVYGVYGAGESPYGTRSVGEQLGYTSGSSVQEVHGTHVVQVHSDVLTSNGMVPESLRNQYNMMTAAPTVVTKETVLQTVGPEREDLKVSPTKSVSETPGPALSETMSVTPPLPPLSPGDSPDHSPAGSPQLQHKYKLSYSATMLNKPDLLEPTPKGDGGSPGPKKDGVTGTRGTPNWRGRVEKGRQPGSKESPQTRTKIPLTSSVNSILADAGDMTSTTTALDLDSLLDATEQTATSDDDLSTTIDAGDAQTIRRQLESLEGMYSEVLKLLGSKRFLGNRSLNTGGKLNRRTVYGSVSSLPSSVSARPIRDRRRQDDRKRAKDKSVGKRFQRLESHVVTLARSVAHLSSEMRTQHLMIQEMESIKSELAQLRSQPVRVQPGNGHRTRGRLSDWDSFREGVPALTNPSRVRKLTKFFGDEPPLLRIFLKKLGYEKYASLFESEGVGMVELPYLSEERLQKMGIPLGPRVRILQEAQLSLCQDNFNVYVV